MCLLCTHTLFAGSMFYKVVQNTNLSSGFVTLMQYREAIFLLQSMCDRLWMEGWKREDCHLINQSRKLIIIFKKNVSRQINLGGCFYTSAGCSSKIYVWQTHFIFVSLIDQLLSCFAFKDHSHFQTHTSTRGVTMCGCVFY